MPLQQQSQKQQLPELQQEILETLRELDAADIETITTRTSLTRQEVREGIHSLWQHQLIVTNNNYKYTPTNQE